MTVPMSTTATTTETTANEHINCAEKSLKRPFSDIENQSTTEPLEPLAKSKSERILNLFTREGNDIPLHLAPMVRIGTLPTRLLALEYGASLVWGPEIVDRAILESTRTVDPVTGVINYTVPNTNIKPAKKKKGKPSEEEDEVLGDRRVIFSTHPIETPNFVFQLGTADPDLAKQAVAKLLPDIRAISLNAGCPKHFSVHNGMGAGLLEPERRETMVQIIKNLCSFENLVVDVKIRLRPTEEDTENLVTRIITETKMDHLSLHCRTREMRSSEPALWSRGKTVVDLVRKIQEEHKQRTRPVEVTINGDCFSASEAQSILEQTGAPTILIARGAERNPSCFSSSGPEDLVTKVIPRLLSISEYIKNPWGNTKYILNTYDVGGPAGGAPPLSRKERGRIKEQINQLKNLHDGMAQFPLPPVEGSDPQSRFEQLVPNWYKTWSEIK